MMQEARDPRDELYEEYLRVPEHQHAEIIRGTLYVMSRPAPKHTNAATLLSADLVTSFHHGRGGPGGWWILHEPELQLVLKEPVVPDIAGWRIARMPQLPDTAYFALVPDWVCEVLSPSTEKLDRDEKLPYYAEFGVRHAWLVDPANKHLEVYALDENARRWREAQVYRGDAPIRAAPFDASELDLSTLWAVPRRT